MDLLQLRNVIESEGGVLNALDSGYRDEDIDDDEVSELWYELQVIYDNLVGEIAQFMDDLYVRLDDAQGE